MISILTNTISCDSASSAWSVQSKNTYPCSLCSLASFSHDEWERDNCLLAVSSVIRRLVTCRDLCINTRVTLQLQLLYKLYNSVWSSDTVRRHRIWLALVQAMAWCSIGSGNGLVPDGTKPLPEPMLTNDQWSLMAFTWNQFYWKYSRYLSTICVWKLLRI